LAPDIFVIDTNDGKALLVNSPRGDTQKAFVFSGDFAELKKLAAKCPVDAIQVSG
jgi:ferredoxin